MRQTAAHARPAPPAEELCRPQAPSPDSTDHRADGFAIAIGRAKSEGVAMRLAVIRSAAESLARRPDGIPDDVLAVAIQRQVWVEEADGV